MRCDVSNFYLAGPVCLSLVLCNHWIEEPLPLAGLPQNRPRPGNEDWQSTMASAVDHEPCDTVPDHAGGLVEMSANTRHKKTKGTSWQVGAGLINAVYVCILPPPR